MADGQVADFRQRPVRDKDISCRAVEPSTFAVRAGLAVQISSQFFTDGVGFGLAIAPVEVRNNAFESVFLLDLHTASVLVVELDLFLPAAVKDDLLQCLRQVAERRLDVEVVVLCEALDHLKVIGRLPVPATNRATGQ